MLYSVLSNLSRFQKRMLFLSLDTFLVLFSLYVAFALRFGTLAPFPLIHGSWILWPVLGVLGAGMIMLLRLHRIKLHAFEGRAILRLAAAAFLLTVTAMAVSYLLRLGAPRSVPVIFGTVFFLSALMARLGALALLGYLATGGAQAVPVAVYGAGSAGIQLVSALRQSREVRPVVFVDDNPALWGLIVSGLMVQRPEKLAAMARSGRIQRVLLAMPSTPRSRLNALLEKLSALGCDMQILPSYVDLISGRELAGALQTVAPDELLNRDMVDLDIPDVAKAYAGRVVMVTGAGGSIGSELCRQLLNCRPARIVLFERSEYAL
ncbi:polysaccharide biosynthesis protein, partial [Brevirhabdus pacifica]